MVNWDDHRQESLSDYPPPESALDTNLWLLPNPLPPGALLPSALGADWTGIMLRDKRSISAQCGTEGTLSRARRPAVLLESQKTSVMHGTQGW